MNTHLIDRGMVLLVVTLIFSANTGFSQEKRLEEFKFKSRNFPGPALEYLLYKPEAFKPGKLLPLLIYLHGGSLSDISKIRDTGIPKLIEEGRDFPCIVVSPLLGFPNQKVWTASFVDEFVNEAIKKYPVNINKVYITGISAGCLGVWDYASKYPSKVACAIPISGWGDLRNICQMKDIPTWAFHGTSDEKVGVEGSRNMTYALKECGGDVRLTELEGVGHDAWRKAYTDPKLFDWILSKDKSDTVKKRIHNVRVDKRTIAYQLPNALKEITGVTYTSAGEFLGVSAKNSLPVILSFDTTGLIKRMIRIGNASNVSWQDLALSTNGDLYIADVGNEKFHRKSFQIYKVRESDLTDGTAEATRIEFRVETSEPLNFKSIFFYNDFLYLFGESPTKRIYLIKVSAQAESVTAAILVETYSDFKMKDITSACFDPKRNALFLLNKEKIGMIDLTAGFNADKTLFIALLNLHNTSRKEGLTLMPDGDLAYVDQFFLGQTDGNLYLMQFTE